MEVLDGVLACRLLNNVNLPDEKKQLVQPTVNEMKYEVMKKQLKRFSLVFHLKNTVERKQ